MLKLRLKNEGSQLATTCSQLKLPAADGKKYLTDVADTEQVLRLVQSIPSKKAEPFKLWLAKVGNERIAPELSIDRAIQSYRRVRSIFYYVLRAFCRVRSNPYHVIAGLTRNLQT